LKLKIFIASLLLSPSALAFYSKDHIPLDGFGHDNHELLTRRSINNLITICPDVNSYSTPIIDGASTEGLFGIGAHKSVDNSVSYWRGNESLWESNVIKEYLSFNFLNAYKRLGYVAHLTQDIFVPAHQKTVFHGLPVKYISAPGGNELNPPTVFSHSDRFEVLASQSDNDQIPPSASIEQAVLDPEKNCMSKFWLSDNDDSDLEVGGWGSYGRSVTELCDLPDTASGEDWFADPKYSSLVIYGQRVVDGQLYLARMATESTLERISKQLPPLVRNLQVTGCTAGVTSGVSISFDILENRTPDIIYTINLLQKNGGQVGQILTDATGLNFGSFQLPYAAHFSGIKWDGTINGQRIADGDYVIDVRATDADGNTTPDDVNIDGIPENDTIFSCSISQCSASGDTIEPTVSLNPSLPCLASGSVTLTGHASDNCSLKNVMVNGQSVSIGEKGGDFSVTLNLPEGESTVTAVASDAAGNTAQTSVNVNVDSTAPKVVSKTPEGGPVALSAGVSVTYDEDITEGEITIDGVSGTSVRRGRTLTFQHAKLAEDHTYTVRVTGVKDARVSL
jgi:hypothetical protein